ERQKIEDRLMKLAALVSELEAILADPEKISGIIKEELAAIRDKYADERRTELGGAIDDIVIEDLIERHTAVITMSHQGYIKRLNADTYSSQRRGGKGITGMTTKEEDSVSHVVAVDSHSYLMMFTNFGKVQVIKAYMIPECGRTAKGSNIVNILDLQEGEKVTAMLSVSDFDMEEGKEECLLFVTAKGIVKRTLLSDFAVRRKGGKRALQLDEDDELVYVRHTTGDDRVIIATRDGMAVCFEEQAARVMGRTARGVRGIRLCDGDRVTGVCLVDETKKLVTITEKGFGKRCEFDEFSVHNRGGKGVRVHGLSDKTGRLAAIMAVSEEEDLMLLSSEGIMIRVSVADIPAYGRSAGGVIVMRLPEDEKVVGFTVVEKEEEELSDLPGEETTEKTVEEVPEENTEEVTE
ncbi:MAG: DNA gyrase subunit A, partial [Clostridia bacterium]|nr:DNA gyrase subunit A [Clostridia bacterium]